MRRADEVIEALGELIRAIEETSATNDAIVARATRIKRDRKHGLAYSEIVHTAEPPLIVEMISDNLRRLTDAGTKFRRAEAKALHREGLTMETIADLFGVTRQRISAILARAESSERASGGDEPKA